MGLNLSAGFTPDKKNNFVDNERSAPTSTVKSLLAYGDDREKYCYKLFIEDRFPNYEVYWLAKVEPNRKKNSLAIDDRLNKQDKYRIQLHYTVLVHLERSYKAIHRQLNDEEYSFAIISLQSALDVAHELIGRSFSGKDTTPISTEGSKFARKKAIPHKYPLQDLSEYRNILVHAALVPMQIKIGSYTRYRMPKFGLAKKYVENWNILVNEDWSKNKQYFSNTDELLADAFNRTCEYLNTRWQALV